VGFYEGRVLPRLVDLCCGGKAFAEVRARVCAPLDREVLEVGFGSGRNVPHYPHAVTRVLAVDPSQRGRELARRRLGDSPVPVEFVGLDRQQLPLADGSVDHVLCTWSLCTIPDPGQALGEMRRVLRPGGQVHFVEHGLAPDAGVAKWQHRLTPIQRRVAGGCHLDRPIDALITGAGFDLAECATYFAGHPKPFTYFYEGRTAPLFVRP
jgi:SAM-dependent methyltransferase